MDNIDNVKQIEFSSLEHIIHRLILESSFLVDSGLLRGKMGILIFFCHYSEAKDNDIYAEVSKNLYNGVLEEVCKIKSIDFASGISGIGWAIEYLIHYDFIEEENTIIDKEIEKSIMNIDPRRIHDYSLETGLEGLLHYVIARWSRTLRNKKSYFDELYLADLYSAINAVSLKNISESLTKLIIQYRNTYHLRHNIDYLWRLRDFIEINEIDNTQIINYPLGIKNGLSGMLFKSIFPTF